MSDTRNQEAVELFVEVAQGWLNGTKDELEKLATSVDEGRFDANVAAASGARLAALQLLAAIDFVRAISAAGAVLGTPRQPPPRVTVTDDPTHVNDKRSLFVAEPFTSGFAAPIPANQVVLDPQELKPGDTSFDVVLPLGCKSAAYLGQVTVVTAQMQNRQIPVVVQVG